MTFRLMQSCFPILLLNFWLGYTSLFPYPLCIILQRLPLKYCYVFPRGAVRKPKTPFKSFIERGAGRFEGNSKEMGKQQEQKVGSHQSSQEGPHDKTQPLPKPWQGKERTCIPWAPSSYPLISHWHLLLDKPNQRPEHEEFWWRDFESPASCSTEKVGKCIRRGKGEWLSTAQFMAW